MDRRSAVEQQYRSSGTVVGGKKRRVGVRLKRSTTVSEGKFASSHLVSGEEQQPSGAIKSLAYEIDTVAQEQEEVLGLLRRKSGLFRGLGGRFKSVIRGTGGEHHLVRDAGCGSSITASITALSLHIYSYTRPAGLLCGDLSPGARIAQQPCVVCRNQPLSTSNKQAKGLGLVGLEPASCK